MKTIKKFLKRDILNFFIMDKDERAKRRKHLQQQKRLDKIMFEMRNINEQKRLRTKYLWDLVRKWYRLRRFMNHMDDIAKNNHIAAQSGIVQKEEMILVKSNIKDQKYQLT